MSRNNSDSKAARKFLEHARTVAKYWAEQPNITPLERTEGAVFSILVALDGESCAVPPHAVRPINQTGKEGSDIAGNLHDSFYQQ